MGKLLPLWLYKLEILLLVVIPLAATVYAIFLLWNNYVFLQDIVLLSIMYTLTMLGITVGYHRMLTHQGFETHPLIRGLFLIFGCMAFEGRPLDWAPTHIKHHAHSDDEGDPHSPLHGFWHAHIGWIFSKESFAKAEDYAPQLLKDRTVLFVDRFYGLWMVLALIIPFAIGGWTGLLWGGLVRIFLNTHVTYSVNSICHTFGRRAFETTDESRNEWLVGLLAFGEGWHNNHHAFPKNAFHGMRWWQVDFSGRIIRLLERLGLAWNVQRVSAETIAAQQVRSASMQEALAELRRKLTEAIAHAQTELLQLLEASGCLSAEQKQLFLASYEQAASRLSNIRRCLSRATNLKKQRLHAYLQEVQSLVIVQRQMLPVAVEVTG